MTDPSQYFKGRTVQEQMNEVIGYVDVRSAEVATDAIAADVAQVHQDMLDADADASAAAASAAAAAGTLANAVKKTGEASQSIAGDIAVAGDLTGGTVTVPTPVNNTDAANKKYVDDVDALKADKTYVDAQDALKINITDINQYAVGLTGNQSFNGIKAAIEYTLGASYGIDAGSVASVNDGLRTHWFKMFEIKTSYRCAVINIIGTLNNIGLSIGKFVLINSGSNFELIQIYNKYRYTQIIVCATIDSSGKVALWVNEGQYIAFKVNIEGIHYGTNVFGSSDIDIITGVSLDHKPTTSDGYTDVKDCVGMNDVVIP